MASKVATEMSPAAGGGDASVRAYFELVSDLVPDDADYFQFMGPLVRHLHQAGWFKIFDMFDRKSDAEMLAGTREAAAGGDESAQSMLVRKL